MHQVSILRRNTHLFCNICYLNVLMFVPDLRAEVSWVTLGRILDGKGPTKHPVSPKAHRTVLFKPFWLQNLTYWTTVSLSTSNWYFRANRVNTDDFILNSMENKVIYLNRTVPLSVMGRSAPIRISEFGFIRLIFIFRHFHNSVLWLLQFSSFLRRALVPPTHLKTTWTQSIYNPHRL